MEMPRLRGLHLEPACSFSVSHELKPDSRGGTWIGTEVSHGKQAMNTVDLPQVPAVGPALFGIMRVNSHAPAFGTFLV